MSGSMARWQPVSGGGHSQRFRLNSDPALTGRSVVVGSGEPYSRGNVSVILNDAGYHIGRSDRGYCPRAALRIYSHTRTRGRRHRPLQSSQ